jgi:heterodisulfide reductase subunit B
MCQMNLDAYQGRVDDKYGLNKRLPVYFLTELVGLALGISPVQMQVDRHFTEALGLLKELRLL